MRTTVSDGKDKKDGTTAPPPPEAQAEDSGAADDVIDMALGGFDDEDGSPPWTGKWGVFSAKAAKAHGTMVYFGPDGREVEVTATCEGDPKAFAEAVRREWDDAAIVGPVCGWARHGSRGALATFSRMAPCAFEARCSAGEWARDPGMPRPAGGAR